MKPLTQSDPRGEFQTCDALREPEASAYFGAPRRVVKYTAKLPSQWPPS